MSIPWIGRYSACPPSNALFLELAPVQLLRKALRFCLSRLHFQVKSGHQPWSTLVFFTPLAPERNEQRYIFSIAVQWERVSDKGEIKKEQERESAWESGRITRGGGGGLKRERNDEGRGACH